MESTEQQALEATRTWVEKFIIGLNLCPFAAKVKQQQGIRYAYSAASDIEALYQHFLSELSTLIDAEPEEIETSLLVYPQAAADFADFWDFTWLCEEAIQAAGLEGDIQVVAFHPRYHFEGEETEAPSNFTNRSPHPMLHLLREKSVAGAIQSHPDVDSIPQRNVDLLNEMGLEGIRKVFEG